MKWSKRKENSCQIQSNICVSFGRRLLRKFLFRRPLAAAIWGFTISLHSYRIPDSKERIRTCNIKRAIRVRGVRRRRRTFTSSLDIVVNRNAKLLRPFFSSSSLRSISLRNRICFSFSIFSRISTRFIEPWARRKKLVICKRKINRVYDRLLALNKQHYWISCSFLRLAECNYLHYINQTVLNTYNSWLHEFVGKHQTQLFEQYNILKSNLSEVVRTSTALSELV